MTTRPTSAPDPHLPGIGAMRWAAGRCRRAA
jgi:hypothetical protein